MKKGSAGVHVQKIGSEYSDKVSKANKQQDLMLQRKLRYIDRQQHMANTCMNRNINEIERLQLSFQTPTVTTSVDLKHFDQQRETERLKRYGALPTADDTASSRQIKLHRNSFEPENQIFTLDSHRQSSKNDTLPPLESLQNNSLVSPRRSDSDDEEKY